MRLVYVGLAVATICGFALGAAIYTLINKAFRA